MSRIAEDIIEMIQKGDLDDDIDRIGLVAGDRIRLLNLGGPPPKKKGTRLSKGQRVRFNSGVRPKYMEGEMGTVLKSSHEGIKTVQLELDDKKGRFKGEKIRAYKSTLDVIA